VEILIPFLVAFVFSFLGSIPPGTLNLTVLQLGLDKKLDVAWKFALAATLIEYPYAWLALLFEDLITSSPIILNHFKLISAVVMITLGVLTIRSGLRKNPNAKAIHESGFKKGLLLGILNPLALPFWIGITAYVKVQGWVTLTTPLQVQSYLAGVVAGAFVLLVVVAYLAKKAALAFSPGAKVKFIPGVILLVLGGYALVTYLLSLG
jgi:threonine/homoserine/homoserine lactone efflux protein